MEKNKIIYKSQIKKINYPTILILMIMGISIVYIFESLFLKIIIAGIFTITIISAIIKKYYANGLVIKESLIEFLKIELNGKVNSEPIQFKEITNVKFNKGGRYQEKAIYLKTINVSDFKVPVTENWIELGHVLKFLSTKGINIELVHSDHELRMYLNGEISEFPMRNEGTA